MPYSFNPFTGELDYTAVAGASGNSFTTIQPDAGTSPVADSASDALTLTSSDGSVSITGDSTTDTIDFKVASGYGKLSISGTRASPNLITGGGTVSVAAVMRQMTRIAGNAGAVSATVSNGTIDGQELIIMGCHATNTVTLTGAGLNGDWIGGLRSMLSLVWDHGATEWVETSRNYA